MLMPLLVHPTGLMPTGFEVSHCQLNSPYEKPAYAVRSPSQPRNTWAVRASSALSPRYAAIAARDAPACVPQLFGRSSCVFTSVRPESDSVSSDRSHGRNVFCSNDGIGRAEVDEVRGEHVAGQIPPEREGPAAVLAC